MSSAERTERVALVGEVALELLAPYFRAAGYETYVPAGFGTGPQELLDPASGLHAFGPDFVFDVTTVERPLADETPGFFDERMRVLASMPYSLAGIRAIVEEFGFWKLRAAKKILAVDADNTLWRGILSEDGPAALEPFVEFQRGLLKLRDDGVVLVLLSKNDPFEFRSDMPLRTGDFAAVKVNWGPKAGNLLEACRELNLAPDSVVFVDDNPHERAQMAAHLPEVAVVPFPSDLASPRQFLRRLGMYFFADAGRTEEDRLRSADYAAERRRKAWGATLSADTLDGYLEGLGLTASPSLATESDLDRLAQMAGKTNQFNATTIRRSRADFEALLADPARDVFVFRAADRFGGQGVVCYVVAEREARRVTDFVMSCRAMGRTLEFFAFAHVAAALGGEPRIDFVPSAKNRPFADFLARLAAGERRTFYRRVAVP